METENVEAKVSDSYAHWSVVELLGRTVYAGYVTEVTHFGATMLRLDVPEMTDREGNVIPAWSKLLGGGSLYALTPVGEDEAKIVMARLRARPLKEYILPFADKPMTMRLLPGAVDDDDESNSREDYDDDDQDDFDDDNPF